MGYKEAREVKGAFTGEYMLDGPLAAYIVSCGLTYRDVAEWYQQGGIEGKKSLRELRAELALSNEAVLEWCILVGLREPLPEDLALPSEYQEVRVFSYVSGGINAS